MESTITLDGPPMQIDLGGRKERNWNPRVGYLWLECDTNSSINSSRTRNQQ